MEKKLTNSGPLREAGDKHSIYPLCYSSAKRRQGAQALAGAQGDGMDLKRLGVVLLQRLTPVYIRRAAPGDPGSHQRRDLPRTTTQCPTSLAGYSLAYKARLPRMEPAAYVLRTVLRT